MAGPPTLAPTLPHSQILSLTTEQIKNRVRILDSNIGVMNTEIHRLDREKKVHEARLKDNGEKIKLNKQLPYLVSNIVEVGYHPFPSLFMMPLAVALCARAPSAPCRCWMWARMTMRRKRALASWPPSPPARRWW